MVFKEVISGLRTFLPKSFSVLKNLEIFLEFLRGDISLGLDDRFLLFTFLFKKGVCQSDFGAILRHICLKVLFQIWLKSYQEFLRDWQVTSNVVIDVFSVQVSFF